MNKRIILMLVTASLALLLPAGMAWSRVDNADKEVVVDGRYVHNVGELWHHVTNWGMLGSAPSVPTTFFDSPSAMWPGGSGDEYLWAAGLWVGGTVLGERLVSTGAWATEFLPTEAAVDSIYRTLIGAPGGARYPWANADDDGDGLEDEEILNGLDDDGDGLVDEDFAALADQHFVCGYTDYEPAIMENHPDHTPLNVKIVQQSMQWSDSVADDFVGYDFTITNMGVTPINDLYVGMFSDNDIGPRGVSSVANDDYAGFASTLVHRPDGSWVPVHMSYMYDGAASNPLPGYVGWVLCGHNTDPAGVTAPAEVGIRSFQRFSGSAAFDQGGDPTNDDERYQLLSRDEWDGNSLPGQQADYRTLISSGPFAELAPGASLSYQVALVLGGSYEEMLANAAEAVVTYRGLTYDRDGDPANGEEFTVHWLREDEAPVSLEDPGEDEEEIPAIQHVRLSASPNPFNPQVELRIELPAVDHALLQVFDLRGRLVDTVWDGSYAGGTRTLTWQARDLQGQALPSGVYQVRLIADGHVLHKRITLLR
jgi:hypothetical protein|nr:FlgD immunoglobulin-like domain containing protein [Candidatus Krumholzibacteria bacterium]